MALGLPRAEMLARMSSAELSDWQAFMVIEPFGSEASYIGHAITAATIVNMHKDKRQPAAKVEDMMPKFGKKKPQSVAQMLQIAQAFTIGLGGQDLRGVDDG